MIWPNKKHWIDLTNLVTRLSLAVSVNINPFAAKAWKKERWIRGVVIVQESTMVNFNFVNIFISADPGREHGGGLQGSEFVHLKNIHNNNNNNNDDDHDDDAEEGNRGLTRLKND